MFVEQTLISHQTDTNFPRNPYLVLEHYKFSRSLYFLIEQILIFQEALSSPRTPTIFQENLSSPRTHTIFQEGTPSRTDISLIGLGGCFRLNTIRIFRLQVYTYPSYNSVMFTFLQKKKKKSSKVFKNFYFPSLKNIRTKK